MHSALKLHHLTQGGNMKMERKYVVRRRVVLTVVILLLTTLFTVATKDVCYVGTDKEYSNFLGYGSCTLFIDEAVNQ
jgi:hypothetical protein